MSKYSQETTKAIPSFDRFNEEILTLLNREGGKCQTKISPKHLVIDMDRLKDHHDPSAKSVDIVFGCEGNCIQLAECKYRVKNVNKLKEYELKAKVSNTKAILTSQNCEGAFAPQCVLIPSNQLVNMAINYLNRLYAKTHPSKQPFKVMSTSDFLAEYFK